jgi:hypothetical protein
MFEGCSLVVFCAAGLWGVWQQWQIAGCRCAQQAKRHCSFGWHALGRSSWQVCALDLGPGLDCELSVGGQVQAG